MANRWLIRQLVMQSQKLPAIRARGNYRLKCKGPVSDNGLARSESEFGDEENLLASLDGIDLDRLLRDQVVLDYGSGYGGRTVWYAERARRVEGVEIFASMVEASQEFARRRGAANTAFSLGGQDTIRFPDGSFDTIISFDVLEHVEQPASILREFRRVLRPGGQALVIFTPYWGACSHHLNYVTLFPGLHWVFPAEDLIDSINDLVGQGEFEGVRPQPAPPLSHDGARRVIPSVNGLTKPQYERMLGDVGFEVEMLRVTPLLERFPMFGALGAWLNRAVTRLPRLDEAFSHNLVSLLRRPQERAQS